LTSLAWRGIVLKKNMFVLCSALNVMFIVAKMEPCENHGRCRHRKRGATASLQNFAVTDKSSGRQKQYVMIRKSGDMHKAKNTTTVYMVSILNDNTH